jgi:hypothetical protein
MKKKISASEKTISYRIKGFLIRRFALVEPGYDIRNEFNPEKLKFGIKIELSHNIKNSTIIINLSILIQYEIISKDVLLLELVFQSEFEFQNIEQFVKSEENDLNIPDDLLTSLVSLTYSSARGIIFAKTQGSFLNQFLLPIIDPKELKDFGNKQTN